MFSSPSCRLGTVAIALNAMTTSVMAAEVTVLEPVIIQGKRPVIADQPQRLEIVTADEIRQSGSTDLAQLLRQQPACAVREYGPGGSLSSATLRGTMGEGVLVLRDGIKLNSPERGSVDLSVVSLAGVDHVEILYGGSSSLYGSEAIGGVINLISKTAPSNRVEAGTGSWGHRYVNVEAGQVLGDASIALGLRRSYADNDYLYHYRDQTQPRANAKLDGLDLSFGVKQSWGYDQLAFNLNLTQQTKGVPGPVNFPTPEAKQQDLILLGALKWSQQWDLELKQETTLSHQHSGLSYSDPPSLIDPGADSLLDSTDMQSQLVWNSDPHQWRLGVGITNDVLDSSKLGRKSRVAGTAFLHDSWYLNQLTWLADLRLDHNAIFGLNASPRLGLTYFLDDRHHFRGAIGQAYRGPTFNDLYWPSSSYAAGNPQLLPETTRVYEIGWDFAPLSTAKLETTVFYNQGSNTIAWKSGTGGVWSPTNIGQTETRGLEIVGSYQPVEILSIQGDGTWLSAIDRSDGTTSGKVLMYRPDLVAKASVVLKPSKHVSLQLAWTFTGKRYTTADNTDLLPAYQLWSCGASYDPFPGNTLTLQIDNLLNEYYQSQPYYPMPGRAIRGSWAHAF